MPVAADSDAQFGVRREVLTAVDAARIDVQLHGNAGPAQPASGRRAGRAAGWRRALTEAGAVVPPVLEAGWDPERAHRIGLRVADRDDVTAVLCGNDELAVGFMRGLHEAGRTVPDDISVVGFDDHPLGRYLTPALTTVRQDFTDLGRRSFTLLGGLLDDGKAARTSSTAPSLVIRESSGPPPAAR